jgi:hypothetical protein
MSANEDGKAAPELAVKRLGVRERLARVRTRSAGADDGIEWPRWPACAAGGEEHVVVLQDAGRREKPRLFAIRLGEVQVHQPQEGLTVVHEATMGLCRRTGKVVRASGQRPSMKRRIMKCASE